MLFSSLHVSRFLLIRLQVLSSDDERGARDDNATVTATDTDGSICAESIAKHDPYQVLESEVESFLKVLETQQVGLSLAYRIATVFVASVAGSAFIACAISSDRGAFCLVGCEHSLLSMACQGLSDEQLRMEPLTQER